MQTIAVYNKKGGIGKTTTVQNLAVSLANRGYKVGVFDFDGQAHQKKCYQLTPNSDVLDLRAALLEQKKLTIENFHSSDTPNLWVMTNNNSINSAIFAHFEFADVPYVFENILSPIFDFAIVDCPPSLDAPAINALVASNYVLSPVEFSSFGMESLKQLISNLESAKRYNPKIVHLGLFGSKVDSRYKLTEVSRTTLEKNLQDLVFATDISTNTAFANAQAHNTDIYKYGDQKAIAQFNLLTDEVLKRINKFENA